MRPARPLKIAAAYLLDALWGDPRGYPHPVRAMGACIGFLDRAMIPADRAGERARRAGCALTGMVVAGSWLCARALLSLPGGTWLETLVLYTCLARKDLEGSALRVAEALEAGDLPRARRLLGDLVGRDTEVLDGHGVCRAAVESVAENYVDGVLAPLLWMALGGAPAATAFKAASTLDSMLGHRDERHLVPGWCSARLDDLFVFPAARMSIPLVSAAAFLCGLDGREAWRTGWRYRLCHESPNSAHPEAAFAGALGVGLGGRDTYRGKVRVLPEIGEGTRGLTPRHVREAVRLLNAASHLGLLLALLLATVSERGGRG
ncbi:MAG: cobalamin biosynthesis protein CobD [Actinobacteria bacterium]|nr:cobalamin biosynthesis protein CobD [Actinomycetota bacterium]